MTYKMNPGLQLEQMRKATRNVNQHNQCKVK